MKSYANFDEAIGAAREAQKMLGALDEGLYAMDGEIPNDDADRHVKEVRAHLYEAGKALGYLASGMWTVTLPVFSTDAPDWDEADHASAKPWTKQTLLRHMHEQHRHDRSRLGDTKAGLVEWHAWIHDGE